MILLVLALLLPPGRCVFVDQHEAGVALVRLPGGALAELELESIVGVPLEGAWLCPAGLAPPLPRPHPGRLLPMHATLEELSR